MVNEIQIKEINQINVDNGVLINGFPSSGITSAIATESMICLLYTSDAADE